MSKAATQQTAATVVARPAVPLPAKHGTPAETVDAIPIRGAALKIVENMETSLSVPTATSQRRIPVKLLDENRRIINKYLQENDRGKASYTHLIAWRCCVRSMSFRNSTMASTSRMAIR